MYKEKNIHFTENMGVHTFIFFKVSLVYNLLTSDFSITS